MDGFGQMTPEMFLESISFLVVTAVVSALVSLLVGSVLAYFSFKQGQKQADRFWIRVVNQKLKGDMDDLPYLKQLLSDLELEEYNLIDLVSQSLTNNHLQTTLGDYLARIIEEKRVIRNKIIQIERRVYQFDEIAPGKVIRRDKSI